MSDPRQYSWRCPGGCGTQALITQVAPGDILLYCLRCHPTGSSRSRMDGHELYTRWHCAGGDLDLVIAQDRPGHVLVYCLTDRDVPAIQPFYDPTQLPKGAV